MNYITNPNIILRMNPDDLLLNSKRIHRTARIAFSQNDAPLTLILSSFETLQCDRREKTFSFNRDDKQRS